MSSEILIQNGIEDCKGFEPSYKQLSDYSQLIEPSKNITVSFGDGELDLTKKIIRQVVYDNTDAVKLLAKHLKADTVKQTVFNVWHWIRREIPYQYDTEGIEEIRTPQRQYAEKRGDCDCFTVFAICLFRALGIDSEAHIVTFQGKSYPSHIYAVVGTMVCDPVLSKFNEVPAGVVRSETQVMKFNKSSKTPNMNGLGAIDQNIFGLGDTSEIERFSVIRPFITAFADLGRIEFRTQNLAGACGAAYEMLAHVDSMGLVPSVRRSAYDDIKKGLYAAAIMEDPSEEYIRGYESLDGLGNWFSSAWDSTKSAVSNAVSFVAKPVVQAVNYVADKTADAVRPAAAAVSQAGGWLSTAVAKAVTAAKNAVVQAWHWAGDNIVDIAKKIGAAIAQGAKWIASNALKILLAVPRIAFLALIKLNFLGMATKLAPGCHDEATAVELGYNMDAWKDAQTKTNKLLSFWHGIGGDPEALVSAILTAKNILSFGLSGADPLLLKTQVATAAPVLQRVLDIIGTADASLKQFFDKVMYPSTFSNITQPKVVVVPVAQQAVAPQVVASSFAQQAAAQKNAIMNSGAPSMQPLPDNTAAVLAFMELVKANYLGIASKLYAANLPFAAASNMFPSLQQSSYDQLVTMRANIVNVLASATHNIPSQAIMPMLTAAVDTGHAQTSTAIQGLGMDPMTSITEASVATAGGAAAAGMIFSNPTTAANATLATPILVKVMMWLKDINLSDITKGMKDIKQVFGLVNPSKVDKGQQGAADLLQMQNSKLKDPNLESEYSKGFSVVDGGSTGTTPSAGSGSSQGTPATTNSMVDPSLLVNPQPNVSTPATADNTMMYILAAAAIGVVAVMGMGGKKHGHSGRRRR